MMIANAIMYVTPVKIKKYGAIDLLRNQIAQASNPITKPINPTLNPNMTLVFSNAKPPYVFFEVASLLFSFRP